MREDANSRRGNLIAFWILFVVLTIAYGLYHYKIPISSDTTTTLPMAIDLTRGNIWLKGWVLGSNNFYFTEIVVYALGKLLGFSNEILIGWIPALAMAFMIVGTLQFLDVKLIPEKVTCGFIVFLIFLFSVTILIPYQAGYTLLNANSHNNLYAFVVLYLLIIKKYMTAGHRRWLIAAGILCVLLSFSEGVTTMVLLVPLALFCLVRLIRDRDRKYAGVAVTLVIGWLGSKVVFWIFDLAGGMITDAMAVHLAAPSLWPSRIAGFVVRIATLLGFPGYFDPVVDSGDVLCTILLVLFAIMLVYVPVQAIRDRLPNPERLLYLIVLINLGACVATTVEIFERYAVPAVFWGMILTACMLRRWTDACAVKTQKYAAQKQINDVAHIKKGLGERICMKQILIVVITVALGSVISVGKIKTVVGIRDFGYEQKAAVKLLQKKNLKNGYADFMIASLLSYYSNFEENIQPVSYSLHNDLIIPHTELIKQGCYAQKHVNFIVTYADGSGNTIDTGRLFKKVGAPTAKYTVYNYVIYYWKGTDLSDYLNNAYEDGRIDPEEFSMADGAALNHDGSVTLPDNGMTYGPDACLEKGTYRVTYSGSNFEDCDYDVYSNSSGYFPITPVEKTDGILTYEVKIDARVNDLQFRLRNNDREPAVIRDFELARVS